jgi:hypothetical protein
MLKLNFVALLQGWRIEMEDAHSAIIGIPDQKESGPPFFPIETKSYLRELP